MVCVQALFFCTPPVVHDSLSALSFAFVKNDTCSEGLFMLKIFGMGFISELAYDCGLWCILACQISVNVVILHQQLVQNARTCIVILP